MLNIRRSHQGFRISRIGCEGCGNTVGFMILGLWIELDFLHGVDPV